MIAKFVYESIADILKPKSQEEIENALGDLKATKLLRIAIDKNMSSLIRKALESGNIVLQSIRDFRHIYDSLHLSSYNELFNMLINEKSKDKILNEYLKKSCQLNFPELFNYTIKKGANVNYKDMFGSSILYYACKYENLGFVKKLVELGANIKDKNNEGVTTLGACLSPANVNISSHNSIPIDENIIFYLIEKGVDIYEKNKYGNDLFGILIADNKNKIAYDLLVKLNIKPTEENISSIIRHSGSAKFLNLVLDKNPINLNKPLPDKEWSGVSENRKLITVKKLPIELVPLSQSWSPGIMATLIKRGAKLTPKVLQNIKKYILECDSKPYYQNQVDKWKKFLEKYNMK